MFYISHGLLPFLIQNAMSISFFFHLADSQLYGERREGRGGRYRKQKDSFGCRSYQFVCSCSMNDDLFIDIDKRIDCLLQVECNMTSLFIYNPCTVYVHSDSSGAAAGAASSASSGPPGITSKGFQFLLMGTRAQLWFFLLRFLYHHKVQHECLLHLFNF